MLTSTFKNLEKDENGFILMIAVFENFNKIKMIQYRIKNTFLHAKINIINFFSLIKCKFLFFVHKTCSNFVISGFIDFKIVS